ncbi:hypothetical protein HMPREF9528_01053 [Staphylococcus aureus subsp. aureus MRSA131]|nr:hypothetical protein HMPREF9528_01053 [Staphylococcus aureus subsp. aureus MRSA131]
MVTARVFFTKLLLLFYFVQISIGIKLELMKWNKFGCQFCHLYMSICKL